MYNHLNEDVPVNESKKSVHKTFVEFCNQAHKLKLCNWTVFFTDTNASFKLFTSPYEYI